MADSPSAEATSAPVYPPLPDVSALDPEVQRLLAEHHDAAEADPYHADLWLAFGKALHANQLATEALEVYEYVLALDSRHAQAWYYRGLIHVNRVDDARAREAFSRALRYEPSSAAPAWRLGFVHLDAAEFDEAEQAFHRALQNDPRSEPATIGLARTALEQKQPERALELLEDLSEWSRQNRQYAWLLMGAALRQMGRVEEAAGAIERASGSEALLTDSWEQELLDYRASVNARLTRAAAYRQAGLPERAIELLEALRRDHPEHALVRSNLAGAYREAGRLESALDEVRAALRLNAENPDILVNAAMTMMDLSYRAPNEQAGEWRGRARDLVARAMDRNPGSHDAHVVMGDVHFAEGRIEEALDAYRQAMRCDPARVLARFRMGVALLHLGQWDEAATSFRRAIDRDPRHFDSMIGLANALVQSGAHAEAREMLNRASRINPHDQRIETLTRMMREGRQPDNAR